MPKSELRNVQWQAKWIWTGGKPRLPFQVVYLRRAFHLEGLPPSGTLRCCADSKYRLWINGTYLGFGPARGSAKHPYFDAREITPYLRRGENVIAVLVQHYTAGANIFAAVHGGFIGQIDLPGKPALVVTDRQWRVLEAKAFGAMEGLHFPEIFDARQEPRGWQGMDFDDRAWPRAVELDLSILAPPEHLRARPIPMLPENRCLPDRVLEAGECVDEMGGGLVKEKKVALSLARSTLGPLRTGKFTPAIVPHVRWSGKPITLTARNKKGAFYLSCDFGKIILAAPEVTMTGPVGTIVDLGYSETLENNRIAPMREEMPHHDRIILGSGTTNHRILQPRGFRFLMMRVTNFTGTITLKELSAYEAIYPTNGQGRFESSDEVLNGTYQLGRRTLALCMEDAFTDCPCRERCQWLGDLQPEALFNYYTFGAYDLVRKAILEFSESLTPDGWIPSVFPAPPPIHLPTWSMRFPVIVWEYYLHTGDAEILRRAGGAIEIMMTWFTSRENALGLLETNEAPRSQSPAANKIWYLEVPWYFVDWTPTDRKAGDGAVQGWYLEALDHVARIARELKDAAGAGKYRRKAAALRKNLAQLYWSKERAAFLKYRRTLSSRPWNAPADLIGQHENFLFSRLKVGSAAMRRKALDAVRGATGKYLPNLGNYQSFYSVTGGVRNQKGNVADQKTLLINSPFWSFYAVLALMEAGRDRAALDYLRVGWGLMLDHGATACWEMWDRNTSLCHGWSAAPAMILPAYVLGIMPTSPGFGTFAVEPKIADLQWAKGAVPTPKGMIGIAWKKSAKSGGGFQLNLQVPSGTSAVVRPPNEFRDQEAEVDGRPVPGVRQSIRLEPGSHQIFWQGKRNINEVVSKV